MKFAATKICSRINPLCVFNHRIATKNCLISILLFSTPITRPQPNMAASKKLISMAVVLAFYSLALFFDAAGAIICYKQPGVRKSDLFNMNMTKDLRIKLVVEKKDHLLAEECQSEPNLITHCFVAINCTVTLPGLNMSNQDFRTCASQPENFGSGCNTTYKGYGGKSLNELCEGGCWTCDTDYCNGPPNITTTTTPTATTTKEDYGNSNNGDKGNQAGNDGSLGSFLRSLALAQFQWLYSPEHVDVDA